MAELTRQQKIDRLRGFIVRLKELNEQGEELEAQDAVLQEKIDDFASLMEMEVTIREEGRGAESLLDMEEARQTLDSLKKRRSDISKKIDDINAEYAWLEEQVEAIDVS